MKRLMSVVLAGLVVSSLGLSGCDEYSAAIKYGVRNDPLMVAAQPGQLGDDRWDPDRPATLPLMHAADVDMPENPLPPKAAVVFKDKLLLDAQQIADADRQKLDEALTKLFGTPAEPKVEEIDEDVRKTLGLEADSLKEGSRHYRIHCVHCHGVPGDGRGPTARWISPHPRDFRQGLFKFMSVDQSKGEINQPPRRDDLYYTLHNGLEGTAMPSFATQLGEKDLNHLVSYVIHLSLRGKAEFDTIKEGFEWKPGNNTFTPSFKRDSDDGIDTPLDAAKKWHQKNVARWMKSQKPTQWIEPVPYNWKFNKKDSKNETGSEWQVWEGKDDAQKSLIRGTYAKALFTGEEPTGPVAKEAKQLLEIRGEKPADVKCAQCHTDYGRQAKFKFDSWATLVRPNNFTVGVFRGGRRPIDIYDRVHSGINGSGMTPFGGTISSNSIWDMVEFVQALAYPAMRNRLDVKFD